MQEQKKERKRKLIVKTKAPELVHSVKVNPSIATTTPQSTSHSRFQGLWK
jgi:hypothetical protein